MLGRACAEPPSKSRKVSETNSGEEDKEGSAASHDSGEVSDVDNDEPSASPQLALKGSTEKPSKTVLSDTQAPVARALPSLIVTGADPDYTAETSRLVEVRDESRERPALLLNQELSQKLQDFVTAESDLALSTIRQEKSKPILAAFETYIKRGYDGYAERYQSLRDLSGSESEMRACLREVDAINEKLKRQAEIEEQMTDAITNATAVAQRARLEAAVVLEEVFQHSRLLPLRVEEEVDPELLRDFGVPSQDGGPDAPGPSSKSKHPSARSGRSRSSLGQVPVPGARHHPPSPPGDSEEVERLLDLRDAYWTAHDKLNRAREDFDQRASKRDKEAAAFRARLVYGQSTSETAVDFDLRHLLEGRELTRRLIDAEKAFDAAKAKAVEAHLKIGADDQSSGFVSESRDGAAGDEVNHKDRIHKPTIQAWLDKLPDHDGGEWDKLPSRRPSEVDATGSETDSIDIGDSASAVADGSERRKIDKWQRKCEELRED